MLCFLNEYCQPNNGGRACQHDTWSWMISNIHVRHAFRAFIYPRHNKSYPSASALAIHRHDVAGFDISPTPTCQLAGWTHAALFCPNPVSLIDCLYSLMNFGWASWEEETVRLNCQIVDVKPKRSDDNCTLNWGILRINVSTLVLSVLLILFSKPGSLNYSLTRMFLYCVFVYVCVCVCVCVCSLLWGWMSFN